MSVSEIVRLVIGFLGRYSLCKVAIWVFSLRIISQKAMPTNLRRGKDAIVSILLKYIHPSEHIRAAYPNQGNGQRLDGCCVLRREVKKIRRTDQLAIVVSHESFPNTELYCVERYAKVTTEGPADYLFDNVVVEAVAEEGDRPGDAQQVPQQDVPILMPAVCRRNFRADDPDLLAAVDAGAIEIDDDNEPVPENIPQEGQQDQNECEFNDEWGHEGICFRRQIGAANRGASLKHHDRHLKLTKLQLFEVLFPIKWVKECLIPATNKSLGDNHRELDYAEFLRFVGIWMQMCTTVGFERRDFWASSTNTSDRDTPFKFNSVMSKHRFEAILANLAYTQVDPPSYQDRFWEVREMIKAWNENMDDEFIASWMSCLDESMSKWLNKWTCPGFMFVPRKPWPCGNEYHSICCSMSGVMYRIEIVEGKHAPRQAEAEKEFSNLGKTVGLCLRLTKAIHGTGNVVVMDSGFCVLKAIIELRKKGVFSSALIKKRRYWPRYIKGEEIKEHFADKEPGSFDAMKGKMENTEFYVYGMKEPDYVLLFMTSYGVEGRQGAEQVRAVQDDGVTRKVRFQYPEVCANHYNYRDSVDNHNGRRMHPIAIEEQWRTQRWPNKVFQFLLGITEVNCNLVNWAYFGAESLGQVDFRYQLGDELINNPYSNKGESEKRTREAAVVDMEHSLVSLPQYKTFQNARIRGCKTRYIQLLCSCEQRIRVRTYCKCSPGVMRCSECFKTHLINAFN